MSAFNDIAYFLEKDFEIRAERRGFLLGTAWAFDEALAGRPLTVEAIDAKMDKLFPRPVRPTEKVAA